MMKKLMRYALPLLLFVTTGTLHAQSKPNIVLILMDNLGYSELGVYGGGILRGAHTPRIDKFASEGLRLLNFNVETQCTPSRAALLTGRYAVRTGNASIPIDTPLYGLTQWEYTMPKMCWMSATPSACLVISTNTSRNARPVYTSASGQE